jgi:hypothetical protein
MFTRREIHVLIILGLLFPLFFFVNQQTLDQWELAFLIFVIIPLGTYIVTDRERRDTSNKE